MDVDRFRKVCGLLGSNQVGERAAAALKATEILKAEGKSWGDVAVGNVAPSGDFAAAQATVRMFRDLLNDERNRNTRLSAEIQNLKKDVVRLQKDADRLRQRGKPPPPADPVPRRRRPATPPPPTEETPSRHETSEQESMVEYDRALRERVSEALADAEGGTIRMSERSAEFLKSVSTHPRWSDRQREAVEKTLRWFYAGRN